MRTKSAKKIQIYTVQGNSKTHGMTNINHKIGFIKINI